MIYKIYEGLSGYLIAPDGTAVDKVSGQAIPFNKTNTGFQAKLTTDEQIGLIQGKRKPLTLVRRFTREDLLKMYAKSKDVFEDTLGEVAFTVKIQSIANGNNLQPEDVLKARAVVGMQIEKPVKTEAGCIIKPDVMATILEEAGDVSQEQMDQLTASKRVVKSNPKAPKSLTQKVRKAIKEVAEAKQGMKIPFFRIDGVEYQSARSASKALGVAVNTVLKRSKSNKDGWFYIEK